MANQANPAEWGSEASAFGEFRDFGEFAFAF